MAVNMIATNGQVRYHVDEFVIDTPADLNKLPSSCVPGSTAICISNSEVYMKNGAGEWVAI